VPTLGSSLWPLRGDADGHSLVPETAQGGGVGERVATLSSSPWLVRVDAEGLCLVPERVGTAQGGGAEEQVATLGSSPWLVRVDAEGLCLVLPHPLPVKCSARSAVVLAQGELFERRQLTSYHLHTANKRKGSGRRGQRRSIL
jgi:hypothetical protein